MRVDIGDGIRLFVDVDGPGLVPDGPKMVERPTVVLLHGGSDAAALHAAACASLGTTRMSDRVVDDPDQPGNTVLRLVATDFPSVVSQHLRGYKRKAGFAVTLGKLDRASAPSQLGPLVRPLAR